MRVSSDLIADGWRTYPGPWVEGTSVFVHDIPHTTEDIVTVFAHHDHDRDVIEWSVWVLPADEERILQAGHTDIHGDGIYPLDEDDEPTLFDDAMTYAQAFLRVCQETPERVRSCVDPLKGHRAYRYLQYLNLDFDIRGELGLTDTNKPPTTPVPRRDPWYWP